MENQKQCPFCGEEILAQAQKCKHCGEWLIEQPSPPQPTRPPQPTTHYHQQPTSSPSITSRDYTWLYLACKVGFALLLFSFVQDLNMEPLKGRFWLGNRIANISEIANWVPGWIVILLEGALWTYIFIGFKRSLDLEGKSEGVPMSALIYTTIATYSFAFIVSSVDVWTSEGAAILVTVITVILMMALLTLFIMVGVKIADRLEQDLGISLGLYVVVAAGVLSLIGAIFSDNGSPHWIFLLIELLANFLLLYLFKDYFDSKGDELQQQQEQQTNIEN